MTQNRGRSRLALAARQLACCCALATLGATVAIPGAGPASAASGAIRPDTFTGCTWSASSTTLNATNVTYTFNFTSSALITAVTTITLTVPAGTTGTPAIGSGTTPSGLLTGWSVSLNTGTNTLSLSGVSVGLLTPTAFHIVITGLKNTGTAGSSTTTMTAGTILGTDNCTSSNSVTFGIPFLIAPATLSWAATLTGANLSLADTSTADQKLTVSDIETVGAGWNITVAATTFTGTAGTLADTGTFSFNGSPASISSSAAPAAACVTTCTLPTGNTITYPVQITTAASSPAPVKVYSAAAATGVNGVTLSSIGWWVKVPATIRAGTLATTVTVAIATGP